MYAVKVYVNVRAQKLFVYAFILNGAHFLSLNTTTAQKHNAVSPKRITDIP